MSAAQTRSTAWGGSTVAFAIVAQYKNASLVYLGPKGRSCAAGELFRVA